jgi:hypothetical protein
MDYSIGRSARQYTPPQKTNTQPQKKNISGTDPTTRAKNMPRDALRERLRRCAEGTAEIKRMLGVCRHRASDPSVSQPTNRKWYKAQIQNLEKDLKTAGNTQHDFNVRYNKILSTYPLGERAKKLDALSTEVGKWVEILEANVKKNRDLLKKYEGDVRDPHYRF